jgi:hypothetical protein
MILRTHLLVYYKLLAAANTDLPRLLRSSNTRKTLIYRAFHFLCGRPLMILTVYGHTTICMLDDTSIMQEK